MKKKLVVLFYLIISICFSFISTNAILQNMYFKPFYIIITTLVNLILIIGISNVLWKHIELDENDYKRALIVFSCLMLTIEIVIGLKWKYDPQHDIGAVHKAAVEWVQTGTFKNYYEYFSGWTNNIGPMFFLFIFAKIASMFGVTNFYAVYVIVNSILVTGSMVLVSLICKHLGSIKHGILALVIFTFSIQLWVMGGAIYSDSLSMLFPILVFWLYIISKDREGRKKFLIYVIMGIFTAIGAIIKMPVLIMAIAIIIDILLKKGIKEAMKLMVCIFTVCFIMINSLNNYIYSKHLDKEHTENVKRPYTYQVMMGLGWDGRYNNNDLIFTDSFEDPIEKRKELKNEIIKRINERGPSGMYDLILAKSVLDFGDGTYGMADFLGQPSEVRTKMHDWFLYDGKNYEKYASCVTGLHMAILIFMLFGAYERILNSDKRNDDLFAMYLSIFGMWMFLMCWETNRRYFTNYIPVLYVLAILNINTFKNCLNTIKDRIKKEMKC